MRKVRNLAPLSAARPARRRVVLGLEQLEDRSLLSASQPALVDLSSLFTDANSYDPDHILVRFRPDANVQTVAVSGTTIAAALPLVPNLYEVSLRPGVSVTEAVAAYEASPFVLYAEPDYQLRVEVLPNDASFGSLYGLHNTGQSGGTVDADIDAPEAWDTTTGSGQTIVAVIDTGVDYNHPDLVANIWTNADEIAGNGLDDDANGFVDDIHGYDFANNDGNPIDDNNHGTHVAGTIGAVGNNGIGVTGVNWRVQIMALKFLGASGSGSISNAVKCLNYAVANGARISNNSWGGGGFNQAMSDAIANARVQGHIFVAAAGNAGSNNDTTAAYPANYNFDNVVSVAASDRNDNLASFSNYGAATVDLAAPGVSILSTTRNNTYSSFSGTSMATPHVAGVLALVRDQHPTWTYRQVIDQVLNNVDLKPAFQGRTITGGRLNAARAVGTAAPPADTSGPRVTSSTPSGTVTGPVGSVQIVFNEAINTGSFTTGDIVSFTGPGGVNLLPQITGLSGSGTTFTISFAGQSAAGTYSLVLGPDVRDLANNPMNQNNNGVNGEVPGDRYTASFAIPAPPTTTTFTNNTDYAIRDFQTTISPITVNQDLFIGDLNVRINLAHTYDSDLYITLRAPDGTTVVLSNRRGGSGNNFSNTVFDDEATLAIWQGAPPFSGTYRPDSPLSAQDGKNARGTWQLRIADQAGADIGTLFSWSMTVTPTGGGTSLLTVRTPASRDARLPFGFVSEPGRTAVARSEEPGQQAPTVQRAISAVEQVFASSSPSASRSALVLASLQAEFSEGEEPIRWQF